MGATRNVDYKEEQGKFSGQNAFTLTELLVIVGVIGVLGTMLLTTIGRTKLKGHMVYSQNNLRQLAAAYIGYEVEMGEFMPYDGVKGGSWVEKIMEREGYRKGVFFSPICNENRSYGPGDYRKAWRTLSPESEYEYVHHY
tara:strand:- start:1036 stop:1455 length:420 start_codon:yes stop_codon:yes gene_type:complete